MIKMILDESRRVVVAAGIARCFISGHDGEGTLLADGILPAHAGNRQAVAVWLKFEPSLPLLQRKFPNTTVFTIQFIRTT